MSGSWPEGGDYKQYLQYPDRCIVIPRVQNCQVEKDHRGYPRHRAGANAHVYKLFTGANAHALRVFLHKSDTREARYLAVHHHLQQARGHTASLIGFEYHTRGIRIERNLFPVLLMDWVEGTRLDVWVRERFDAGDLTPLRALADKWVTLLRDLRTAQVAHGDLQHGNVLVKDGELLLVDYDCMCVPALVGQPSPEEGLRAYQHPKRGEQPLSLELDHFSGWLIWLTLRALAAQPRLYKDHVVDSQNDNLLFRTEDLRDPDHSALWPKLLSFPDDEVRQLAIKLRGWLKLPFDKVPPFEMDPYANLRVLCVRRPVPWENIVGELAAVPAGAPALPPDLQVPVEEAKRRLEARDRLREAKHLGQLRPFAAAYNSALLDDWLGNDPLVIEARQAARAVTALDEMEAALRNPGDGRPVLALWAQHAALLGAWAEAAPVQQDVQRWQHRIDAAQRFVAALQQKKTHEVADCWAALQNLGGHPDAAAFRGQGELALRQSELLKKLNAIKTPALDEQDRQWSATWNEAELQGCPEAAALRPRWQQALARLEKLRELEDAVARELPTVLTLAADPLLTNYPPLLKLRPAVERIVQVRAQLERLELACRQQPVNWNSIILAADHPFLAHRPLPAAVEPLVREARERRAARQALDAALASKSARAIDAAYQPRFMDDWKDCDGLAERARRARAAVAILDQIEPRLSSAGDGRWLLAAWTTHAATLAEFAEKTTIEKEVQRWQARIAACDRFLQALGQGRTQPTARAWRELEQLGGHPDAAPYQRRADQVVSWDDRLTQLAAISPTARLHEQDALWLRHWDDALLQGCPEAVPLRPRWLEACYRRDKIAAIDEALAREDILLESLIVDPKLAGYEPLRARESKILGVRSAQAARKRLGELCAQRPRDWREIVLVAESPALVGRTLTPDQAVVLQEARQRCQARTDLERALQGRSARAVKRVYRPELIDDWAACADLVRQARAACELVLLLDEMHRVAQPPGNGPLLIDLWKANQSRLLKDEEGLEIQKQVREWVIKQRRVEGLREALKEPVSEQKLLAEWDDLQQRGGDASVESVRDRAELARRRVACLTELGRLTLTPGLEADGRLLALWDDDLFRGCRDPQASVWPARVVEARRRLDLRQRVQEAIRRVENAEATDREIVAAAAPLPTGYDPALTARLELARQRLGLAEKVLQLLTAAPRSDRSIAEAVKALTDAGGLSLVATADRARCEEATRRAQCLNAALSVSTRLPDDVRDRKLLESWNEELLSDCPDADALRPQIALAARRQQSWQELEEALNQEDVFQVAELAGLPLLKNYPPAVRIQVKINELIARGKCVLELIELVKNGDMKTFNTVPRRECLRKNQKLLEGFREWIASPGKVWTIDDIRLTSRSPLKLDPRGKLVQVRWEWRGVQGIDHCLLAVDGERFFTTPEECPRRIVVGGEEFRRLLGVRPVNIPRGATSVYVTIWPVLKLDWIELAGEPLHLGVLRL